MNILYPYFLILHVRVNNKRNSDFDHKCNPNPYFSFMLPFRNPQRHRVIAPPNQLPVPGVPLTLKTEALQLAHSLVRERRSRALREPLPGKL